MTMDISAPVQITLDDLTIIDNEPRVLDLVLAERLQFKRKRKVRDLILRNMAEIEALGPSPRLGAMVEIGSGATREVEEFYLIEGQALLICALSRTPVAAQVRRALIEVFMA